MPKQEIFFEQQGSDRRVEVLKSYDEGYARETFSNMDEQALQHLWNALKLEENYEAADLPSLNNPDDVNDDAKAFLWDQLVEQALEDPRAYPRLTSFFIVNETLAGKAEESIYVSPDWPSAESFAKGRLAAIS
jgi:hypothetical protein